MVAQRGLAEQIFLLKRFDKKDVLFNHQPKPIRPIDFFALSSHPHCLFPESQNNSLS
jgi:hypothetical protein